MKSDIHHSISDARPAVLVVDDDPAVGEFLREALQRWGYHVLVAGSGQESLSLLDHASIDFAILDVRMPGMDGEKVLRSIRERSPDIQVMMMTGYGSIDDAVKFMQLGAVDYVTKPLILEELRLKIHRALEERRTRMLSITDSKTGLFNHYYLMERLEEEIGRARRYTRPLSVLMIDVDHFKEYNDKCGHLAGDEALRQLGRYCEEISRESDIIARFGGEEFVMILTETDLASARIVADRLRECIEKAPFSCEERLHAGCLTVSIGVSQLDYGSSVKYESSSSLINRADHALYLAKEKGRNRVETADPEKAA